MKVILLTNIDRLGNFGEIKDVADGYARNYLIPRKYAVPFSDENLKRIENLKKNMELKKQREREYVSEVKHSLEKTSITVTISVGKDNKVYGSVTKEDIADAIQQQIGIKVDKHNIKLEHPIKEIGVHNVDILIRSDKFPEISAIAKTKIWVVGR